MVRRISHGQITSDTMSMVMGSPAGVLRLLAPVIQSKLLVGTVSAMRSAMISFFCLHCGLKLQVKPEFAGRSSKCPTCKQPLVVPPLSMTQADVAGGQIDGTDSSLAKVGFDGGVTLEQGIGRRSGNQSVQELLA